MHSLRPHLSLIEPDSLVARRETLRQGLIEFGLAANTPHHLARDRTGKPHLVLETQEHVGYSLSKAHLKPRKIAIQALLADEEIGVDLEHWPERDADPAFLHTIANPADVGVISRLGAHGHDAGVALWVIKEAALKLSGEVMIDPRHIFVSADGRGAFKVTTPKSINPVNVSLHIVNTIAESGVLFLVGLARTLARDRVTDVKNIPILHAFGWEMAYEPKLLT